MTDFCEKLRAKGVPFKANDNISQYLSKDDLNSTPCNHRGADSPKGYGRNGDAVHRRRDAEMFCRMEAVQCFI